MAISCLTGARFTMSATLLHQDSNYQPGYPDLSLYGEWVNSQDPLTGEIVRVWEPFPDQPDNPDTPTYDPTIAKIPCLARGIVDGGIRVAGTTERFGDTYENIDYAKLWVPAWVNITKRDRVTNLADKSGHIQWLDEEFDNPDDTLPPVATVFNVNGVTPLFNAFNECTEKFVLLERAEVSSGANA